MKTILKKLRDAGEEAEAQKIRGYLDNLVKKKHECIYQEIKGDGVIAQLS